MRTDLLKRSPGKLYLHVANILRRRLTGGEWEPGAQLPPLTALADEFGVANVTVRQAVAILEDEGLVQRQQGRGTFVSDHIDRQPSFAIASDWSSLIRMVEKSSPKLINIDDTVGHPVVHHNEGEPAPAYRFMKRIHTYNGVPCAVVGVYLDQRCYERAPERFKSEAVIPVLESLPEIRIGRCHQVLTIGQADIDTASLLQIPVNAPIGEVRRVLTDRDGCVIYVGEVSYRGDFVKFEIDVSHAAADGIEAHRRQARAAPDAFPTNANTKNRSSVVALKRKHGRT